MTSSTDIENINRSTRWQPLVISSRLMSQRKDPWQSTGNHRQVQHCVHCQVNLLQMCSKYVPPMLPPQFSRWMLASKGNLSLSQISEPAKQAGPFSDSLQSLIVPWDSSLRVTSDQWLVDVRKPTTFHGRGACAHPKKNRRVTASLSSKSFWSSLS